MEYRDENHVRTRFWTSYKNEAKEYDDEFLRKRNGDLDIVLIFVSDYLLLTVTVNYDEPSCMNFSMVQ